MNTARHRSTLLAAAGTVLALALTACQSGGDGTTSSAPTASAPAASSPAAAAPTAGTGTGTSDATAPAGPAEPTGSGPSGASAGPAGTTGQQGSASTPACTAHDLRVTAARQDGPPYTHLVLTAKNTTGHACRLTGFPHIQFLESHKQDVPAVAESRPAAPVVLTAGAPAYALVKLSDGGVDEDNEPVSAFSVMLDGDSTVIAVTAPGSDGVAVDPAKTLTGYWTPELRNGADDF
ncbi:DUF4232 domain-containing protein [Streptacidiphilus sp. ASG 303]|uniref:DUF4232 domain-containing protein n=1 Tax=Streptacidiphilus sp. ASG 303 TaxID=2896847 RepID=UPI001E2A49BA|nr:DUF4232 domain-containing protein [Streptacidiphilus sp. ASG 303]MCD0483524.1 DUF4232 domain-containing protein [Streptacidiphilus sp. ASG 303]